MVEPQIVVLVVAGSSPVDHPLPEFFCSSRARRLSCGAHHLNAGSSRYRGLEGELYWDVVRRLSAV
jgi:hypothetical protein